MPLLNYTTTIDPAKTIGEIQRCLVGIGARQFLVEYGDAGIPVRVCFAIKTAFGERSFRLPANLAAVEKTLADQARRKKVARKFATADQAARVAWRILKDWVEAQAAIVETGMVSPDEVFLPYMIDGTGRTVYQFMREAQMALPAPEDHR